MVEDVNAALLERNNVPVNHENTGVVKGTNAALLESNNKLVFVTPGGIDFRKVGANSRDCHKD